MSDYKTVIRAGYGIGYIDPVGAAGLLNSTEFNFPSTTSATSPNFPSPRPRYTLSSGLPTLVMPSATAPTGNQRYLVPTDRNQYSQTWSFSIQRALNAARSCWRSAYVGTSGVRLLDTANINAAPPGTTDPTTRQPFGPALGTVEEIANSGHSSYQRPAIENRAALFPRIVVPGLLYVVEIDGQPEQRNGRFRRRRPVSAESARPCAGARALQL